MKYIDPHAHMSSRTTDDYQNLALTGCVALTEPAFWAGYDRVSADTFADYFEQLTTFEPARAAKYHIKHFSWLALNPKEADNREMAKKVLPLIPKFLARENVLGIGEIGVNRVTKNELATFADHLDLALKFDQMILIHTPHLEDKYKGTKAILDVLKDKKINPEKVLIDHIEEHTIEMVLKGGFWVGITLYPQTKVSPERAADMIEIYGSDKILVASACDWGPSLPTAIPHFIQEMRRRTHPEELIEQIVYHNPVSFLNQSVNFSLP